MWPLGLLVLWVLLSPAPAAPPPEVPWWVFAIAVVISIPVSIAHVRSMMPMTPEQLRAYDAAVRRNIEIAAEQERRNRRS